MGAMLQRVFNSPPKLTKAPLDIEVRALDWTFTDDIPDFWYDNNAFATMLLAAFSITLPEGEKQFIRSVRHYQAQIRNPDLKRRVKAFIHQEAHHAKVHSELNALLKRKGFAVDKVLEDLKRVIDKERSLSTKAQLALTVTAEHFTAILADYFLNKHPEELDKMHPELASLWAWHAIEEIEHKSVAFDVYMELFGDRRYLRRLMALQTGYISHQMFRHMMMFAKDSGELYKPKSLVKGLWYFAKPGSILWSSSIDFLHFFGRDFHPWHLDNSAAVQEGIRHYLDLSSVSTIRGKV